MSTSKYITEEGFVRESVPQVSPTKLGKGHLFFTWPKGNSVRDNVSAKHSDHFLRGKTRLMQVTKFRDSSWDATIYAQEVVDGSEVEINSRMNIVRFETALELDREKTLSYLSEEEKMAILVYLV